MKIDQQNCSSFALRQRAEEVLAKIDELSPDKIAQLSSEEIQKILHELRIHQIELTMQNEELEKAQLQLEAARSRYFNLYDLAPCGFCVVNELGIILETNQALGSLLNASRTELILQPLSRYMQREDGDILYLYLKKIFKSKESQSYPLQMKKKDGSPILVQLSANLIENNEKILVCQLILHDIAGLEQELTNERAKSIHSAKLASLGEVYAGVAHEINNPLTIILYSIEFIEKYKNYPEKFSAKIDSILKSVDRITKIVTGLQKFSRRNEESIKYPFILASIANEAILLTETKAKQHATSVETYFKTNAKILCDEVDIEQVIINLLNNAIDAVKSLPEKWVKVYLIEREEHIILQVKDSGCIISPEVEQKMFQPFFTTKPVGQGTGLGLSIIKGILDEHKASISLNREEDNTCFEIKFCKLEED